MMSLCEIRYEYYKNRDYQNMILIFSNGSLAAITQHRPTPTLYRVTCYAVNNLACNSSLHVSHRPVGRANGRSNTATASFTVMGYNPVSTPTHHPLFDLLCHRRCRTAAVTCLPCYYHASATLSSASCSVTSLTIVT